MSTSINKRGRGSSGGHLVAMQNTESALFIETRRIVSKVLLRSNLSFQMFPVTCGKTEALQVTSAVESPRAGGSQAEKHEKNFTSDKIK